MSTLTRAVVLALIAQGHTIHQIANLHNVGHGAIENAIRKG